MPLPCHGDIHRVHKLRPSLLYHVLKALNNEVDGDGERFHVNVDENVSDDTMEEELLGVNHVSTCICKLKQEKIRR